MWNSGPSWLDKVHVEQTGVPSERPILASLIKMRSFGGFSLAPFGMLVIRGETQGYVRVVTVG